MSLFELSGLVAGAIALVAFVFAAYRFGKLGRRGPQRASIVGAVLTFAVLGIVSLSYIR